GLDAERAAELGLDTPWPEAAIAFASTTCLSRGIVKPNRVLSLVPEALAPLQEAIVRFSTVRGWGDDSALASLVGKRIVGAKTTSETVAGPASIAKVILTNDEGVADEISVAWGIR